MSNNNQHKQGYKHTPLGWIPEEWEIKEFVEITSKVLDGTHFSPKSKNGNYKYITSKNIRNEGLDLTDVDCIEEKEHREIYKRCPVLFGDILLTKDGAGTGTCCMNTLQEEFSLLSSVAVLRGKDEVCENRYLFQYIKSPRGQFTIKDAIAGQAITRITLEKIRGFDIIIPPLPEQHKIATILSTWDEAITKTKQIIAQLQQRNKGLMQQLLSGKKRLKGFEEEWKRIHIYEIANEVSLKNREDKQLTVLSCTKYAGLVPSLEYFGRRVFGNDTSTYKVVPKAHFAYATNHIEEGSIGYQDMFEEALISPMYTVFKTSDEVNDDFLYKLLKSHQYIHQYCKRMEGSIDRRGGLRWDEFSKIPLHLPPYKEQTAIASIINKAVEEVKLQEQHLAALQQQKKGLMQKLLTGEVRVKV